MEIECGPVGSIASAIDTQANARSSVDNGEEDESNKGEEAERGYRTEDMRCSISWRCAVSTMHEEEQDDREDEEEEDGKRICIIHFMRNSLLNTYGS